MGFRSGIHWGWKRLSSTVINDLWMEMWFFLSWSVAVCLINEYTNVKFVLSNALLTVLGTVLGLVISFRTTSAYDRFWEGRKLWGSIALASRNLAMIIWIHVPLKRKPKDGSEPAKDQMLRAIIERKSMLNLVQAFSVSVKHYLRSEPGIYYEDLYPLLSFLPQNIEGDHARDPQAGSSSATTSTDDDTAPPPIQTLPMWHDSPMNTVKEKGTTRSRSKNPSFDPEKVLPDIGNDSVHLRPARNPPGRTIYDAFPPFIIFFPIHIMIKKIFRRSTARDDVARDLFGKRKEAPPIDSNIPLEISLFLASYFAMLNQHGLLTPPVATAYNNALTSMQDAVTNLERIRTTPIPWAYQAHLRMSMYLYLFFLPLQVYSAFKWITVPGVAFAAFLYLGFLEIGQEIENPFNYDDNDLDLDLFCRQIQRELAEITAHPAPDPATYIFSAWNQPFAPTDRRNAVQVLRDHGEKGLNDGETVRGVRDTLLRNYREISLATRKK